MLLLYVFSHCNIYNEIKKCQSRQCIIQRSIKIAKINKNQPHNHTFYPVNCRQTIAQSPLAITACITLWLQSISPCFDWSVLSSWKQQFEQGLTRVWRVLYNVLGLLETAVQFFQGEERAADDLLGRVNDPLEPFPLNHCAAGVPHTYGVCQYCMCV